MEVWQWVLVYALLLVLVQAFVYLYLRGEDRDRSFDLSDEGEHTQGTTPSAAPSQPYPAHTQHGRHPEGAPEDRPEVHHAVAAGEDAIVCQHCGTRNEREAIYSYCRSCGSQLGV
ncbi:hypothetical protein ACFQH2_01195 [Natronoarchaeum sp. GCM10025703]|uniref:DUF7577 domain-containing protein n=1 Tax=unclassified Natronoarchaeum TaxID=2620183 RepID=UPI00360935AF